MFGGLKKYRETSWEQEFPYPDLYLPGEAWQCRIWSVEETDAKSDVYRLGAWGAMRTGMHGVQERKENSIIFGSGEEKEVQKILTLSTCIGDGSSSQRLAVHAAVEMIFATKSGRKRVLRQNKTESKDL